MELLMGLLALSAGYPIWRAWWANRHTSLVHTLTWTAAAWGTWTASAWAGTRGTASRLIEYMALCLTACAIIAVLGARRPGVVAWNLVVVGLLAVMLLPVAQRYLGGGTLTLEAVPSLLLCAIFAVGVINYLPTRLAVAAVLLFLGCGWALWRLSQEEPLKASLTHVAACAVGFVPWLAYLAMRRPALEKSALDRMWLDFRDRFGLVWGQRLRDQFNRSANNSGWPVVLTWKGLRRKPGAANPELLVQEEMMETLGALMKRFL